MISTLLNYLANSSAITYIVLALLSVYTIVVFWIFFYRNNALNRLIANEKRSLEILTTSQSKFSPLSLLTQCSNGVASKEILHACEINIINFSIYRTFWNSYWNIRVICKICKSIKSCIFNYSSSY